MEKREPSSLGESETRWVRRRPQETVLYRLIERYYPLFLAQLREEERGLPHSVRQAFAAYLKCGRLEYGLQRWQCTGCRAERRVALSCKRRGICPSCATARMVDTAALPVDEVLPEVPLRQWVFSIPVPLRLECVRRKDLLQAVLQIPAHPPPLASRRRSRQTVTGHRSNRAGA